MSQFKPKALRLHEALMGLAHLPPGDGLRARRCKAVLLAAVDKALVVEADVLGIELLPEAAPAPVELPADEADAA